jgi:predicted DCC family thiol-disulfide oxidoreductase YuxK
VPSGSNNNPTSEGTPVETGRFIVLFDGVCNLCNASVRFLIQRDPGRRFRFASIQSAPGRQLYEAHGQSAERLETIMLVVDGRAYVHSDAALRIARELGGPWSALWPLRFIPRGLRDPIYLWVARHRYRWFGRSEACMVPTPDLKSRFLA